MARYLVEDPEDDFVTLDYDLVQKAGIIKSIMKNLTNNYILQSMEEEESIHNEIYLVGVSPSP